MAKIIKIGTFDNRGMPTGWHFDIEGVIEKGYYCLGLDFLFPGSVDVNGVEVVEWTEARHKALGREGFIDCKFDSSAGNALINVGEGGDAVGLQGKQEER